MWAINIFLEAGPNRRHVNSSADLLDITNKFSRVCLLMVGCTVHRAVPGYQTRLFWSYRDSCMHQGTKRGRFGRTLLYIPGYRTWLFRSLLGYSTRVPNMLVLVILEYIISGYLSRVYIYVYTLPNTPLPHLFRREVLKGPLLLLLLLLICCC